MRKKTFKRVAIITTTADELKAIVKYNSYLTKIIKYHKSQGTIDIIKAILFVMKQMSIGLKKIEKEEFKVGIKKTIYAKERS